MSELNLDQLMSEVRREVSRQKPEDKPEADGDGGTKRYDSANITPLSQYTAEQKGKAIISEKMLDSPPFLKQSSLLELYDEVLKEVSYKKFQDGAPLEKNESSAELFDEISKIRNRVIERLGGMPEKIESFVEFVAEPKPPKKSASKAAPKLVLFDDIGKLIKEKRLSAEDNYLATSRELKKVTDRIAELTAELNHKSGGSPDGKKQKSGPDARRSLFGNIFFSRPPARPRIKISEDATYHVRDLMEFDDEDFIENAYRAILGRSADGEGYSAYLSRMRTGELSKIDVLGRIRYSPEYKGRGSNAKLKGLNFSLFVNLVYQKIPVLGYLFTSIVEIARLPKRLRELERVEAKQNYRRAELEKLYRIFQSEAETNVNQIVSTITQKIDLSAQFRKHAEISEALVKRMLRLESGDVNSGFFEIIESLYKRSSDIRVHLNAEVASRILDLETEKADAQSLAEDLAQLRAEVFRELRAEIEAEVKRLEIEKANASETVEKLSRLSHSRDELLAKHSAVATHLEVLESQKADRNQLKSAIEAVGELKLALDDLEKNSADLSEVEQLSERLSDIESVSAQLAPKVIAHDKIKNDLLQYLGRLKNRIEHIEKIKADRSNLEGLLARINSAERSKADSTDLKLLASRLSIIEKTKVDDSTIAGLASRVSAFPRKFEMLSDLIENQLESANEQAEELQSKMTSIELGVKNLAERSSHLAESVNQKADKAAIIGRVERVSEDIHSATREIERLSETKVDGSMFEMIREQLRVVEKSVSNNSVIEQIISDINSKPDNSTIEAIKADINQKVEQLNAKLQSMAEESRVEKLQSLTDEISHKLTSELDAKADNSVVVSIRSQLSDLNESIADRIGEAIKTSDQKADLADLQELRDYLHSRHFFGAIDTLRNDSEKFREQVGAIEQSIQSIGEQRADLLAKIESLDSTKAAAEVVAEISGKIDSVSSALENELGKQINEKLDSIDERLETIKSEISADLEILDEKLRQEEEQVKQTVGGLADQVKDHTIHIVDGERRLLYLLEEARKRLPKPFDQKQLKKMAAEADHVLDSTFVSIEDELRGTREDIKKSLEIYLPYLEAAEIGDLKSPIVDLGCGRGEWVELLEEKEFAATGVDQNRAMIDICSERGLKVEAADLLEFMHSQKVSSLGAVTGFHVLEYLTFDKVIQVFDEVLRTLKPGGLFIFETPNPENILVGSAEFYLDPLRITPLHGRAVRAMAEARGFTRVEIIKLHPYDDDRKAKGKGEVVERFNELFYGPRDYAIIGYKA